MLTIWEKKYSFPWSHQYLSSIVVLNKSAEILPRNHVCDKCLNNQINISVKTEALQTKGNKTCTNTEQQRFVLTEVLDGVIALLVVHFDGLSMGTSDAIADGVTAHHNILVLWRRPAHHDAVDQWPDVERAGLVWYT